MTAPRGPGPPRDDVPAPGERPEVVELVEVDLDDPGPSRRACAVPTGGTGNVDGTALGGTAGRGETLGGGTVPAGTVGGAGRPVGESPGDRIALWAGSHRTVVRVAGALLGTLALGGAGLAVAASLTGPPLPELVSAQVVLPPMSVSPLPTWSAMADGRPTAPVNVTVDTRLTFRGAPPDGVQVLGPDGPGIVRSTGPVGRWQQVPARAQDAPVTLGADLDCTRVGFPVRAADYGLRVRVRDGRRMSTGVLRPEAITARLARVVEGSCGPWLARQYLTVTAARARFTPAQPWSELDLTVTNSGAFPARLESSGGESGIAVSAPGNRPDGDVSQVRLPARSTTVLHLRLTADRCDGIASALATGSGDVPGGRGPWSTGELLDLTSDVAPARPQESLRVYGDGLGPTGILIAQQAVGTVTAAVSHLCADLHPLVTTVDDLHAHGRVLTLSVTLYLDPGRVRSVDLVPDTTPVGSPFTPLWSARHGLTPDRSGQLSLELDYRTADAAVCPPRDLAMPPFVVRAVVPVPGGVRTVTFTGFAVPQANPGALAQLCR